MNAGRSDDLPPDWLAAYADGELTPTERARVERWLAQNPEAGELLDAQESFGPRNTEFWDAARPPAPSARQWDHTFNEIAPRTVQPRRAWTGWLGSLGLLATAATLLLALPGPQHPCVAPPPADYPNRSPASSEDDEPFLMASADEVRIISLPEAAAALLLVGEHPMGDSMLVLAERGEIAFLGVGNDLAGKFPTLPDDPNTEDAPMIWAPKDP
jgi:anti-sigma factor RsiW